MRKYASLCLATAATLLPLLCVAQSPPPGMPASTAARVLEQATWGPTAASIQDLQAKGFDEWFAEQVAAPVSIYPAQPPLRSDGKTNTNIGPLQVAFFENSLTNPDQLRQRVAFALSEIWVVSNVELNNASAFAPILNIFQNQAFGNYRTLMKAVTLNPAMGRYLNMVNNNKANHAKGTAANENYSREIMQLFTIGLTQLNMDGSAIVDGSGKPVPTFSPATVTNLANAFTGWTYAPSHYLDPMVPLASQHDTTAKTIFNVQLPAGQTAEQDLDGALDAIFANSSMPAFISRQLIEHLVTSNPSPAYIQDVANVFADNGSGVRGDLKAVVRQILIDPEARAGDVSVASESPHFGHLREPVLFITTLLRGLNGTIYDSSTTNSYANQLGQNLFNEQSVFSYFSPFYRTSAGLAGPEFQIYSTQTSASRVNLVNSAVYGGKFDGSTLFNISAFVSAAGKSAVTLTDLINSTFFHGMMSNNVLNAMNKAMAAVTLPADKAKAALYIALSSSEFQIIH